MKPPKIAASHYSKRWRLWANPAQKIGEPEGSPSTATQIRWWLEVELQSKLNVTMLVRLAGDRRYTLLCGDDVEGRNVGVRDLDVVVGVVEHVVHLKPELEVEALSQLKVLRYNRVERPIDRSTVRVTTSHRQAAARVNCSVDGACAAEDDLVRYFQRVSRSKRLAEAGIDRKIHVQEVIC